MSIKSFSLLLVFVLGVVSCSIQKRKYRDGFYLALNHKTNTKAIKKTEVIENIAIKNKAETKKIDTIFEKPLTKVEKINLFMDNKPIKHFFNKVKLLPLSFAKIAN